MGIDALLLCLLLPSHPTCAAMLPPVRAVGIATTFWPGDGHGGGGSLGCVAAAQRLGLREMRDDLPVIAMRGGARCGQTVYVEHARTGVVARAIRLTSGPWGCRMPDGSRVVARHCPAGGRRIALVDLSRSIAKAVGADGWTQVRLRWQKVQ